jgi:hypothetical protein
VEDVQHNAGPLPEGQNTNVAPFPEELADLVSKLEYRPGWKFWLTDKDRGQGSIGLTFIVQSLGYDTYNPDRGETYGVYHYFPVPPAAFNRKSWIRWLLDCLIKIETHETCEFFQIEGEGPNNRPFAPNHGPGNDPYTIWLYSTEQDAKTTFRGEVKD